MLKCCMILLVVLFLNPAIPVANGVTFHRDEPPQSQPQSLVLAGQLTGDVVAVAVHGPRAYLGLGLRVVVLDISHPATPWILGRSDPLSGAVTGLALASTTEGLAPTHLYALSGTDLHVLALNNPTYPMPVGSFRLPAVAEDIVVARVVTTGRIYAYTAAGMQGLYIIDVTDPIHPVTASAFDTPGVAWRVAVDATTVPGRTYAYVTDRLHYLYIVDVTDPNHPVRAATYSGFADGLRAGGIAVANGYAYVGTISKVFILDVTNPERPREIWYTLTTEHLVARLVATGHYLFAYGDPGDFRIINVADPRNPFVSRRYDTRGESLNVAAGPPPLGQEIPLAYIASGSRGLQIVSGFDPQQPHRIGWFDLPGNAYGVALERRVDGTYAYVTDRDGGLHVIAISQPTQPVQLTAHDIPSSAWRVTLVGHHAYVAAGDAGLRIVDTTDPAHPVAAGVYPLPYARAVAAVGDYVYVTDRTYGALYTINVADPAYPVLTSIFATPGGAYDVALDGTLAYIADGVAGLRILDVSKPDEPREIGALTTPGVAVDVHIAGHLAFVAGREDGLYIIDVSDPAHPLALSTYHTSGEVWAVAPVGSYVFLANGTAGVCILDVSNPLHPVEMDAYDTLGFAWDIAVVADVVVVADEQGGLLVLRWYGSQRAFLPWIGWRLR
ncbi:MAG: hypothetical protein WAV70_24295 [Anaerolineae bacterium]